MHGKHAAVAYLQGTRGSVAIFWNTRGTRIHWSYRTVCTPITGPHEADELYLPYKLVVNALKLQILNVLVHRNRYTISEALIKHLRALVVFDQEVYDIMMQLKAECPWKGLPVLIGRNPTLKMFAIQLLFVSKIKMDIYDETLSLSPLILSNSNIDFDGETTIHWLPIGSNQFIAVGR